MSAPVDLTDAASREQIHSSGLDRTLFVEAGAGTGKTTELVKRVVNLVLTEGVRLESVAAITFTEAAAAELQSRIRVAFEKQEVETTDPVRRERCRQAIADADRAAIATLHGFASRLLSEFSVAAGLPPRVSVLDEVSSQLAREARWERFVDALYDDPANEELLIRAALVDVALEPRYPGHSTLKDVASTLSQSWDRLDHTLALDPPPLRPLDFQAFDDAVGALAQAASDCLDHDDVLYQRITTTLLPEMRAVVELSDPHAKLRALDAARKRWSKGAGGRSACWPDVSAAKAAVDAVGQARDDVLDRTSNEVLQHLLRRVAHEVRSAAEERRAEGGLEFHDLLVLARRLLRTSPHVRAVLHDRYRQLLLDEFQDTDPIQIELAVLIAAAVEGDDPGPWDEHAVEEGRIFLVGDPKQSIYRFRRADIGLFLRARDYFGPDGGWLRLVTNFRTVGPVLEWVNALFAELMPVEQPEAQPGYEPLAIHRGPSAAGDHRPILLGGPHEAMKADELREHEAADVAALVADIRDRPERWLVERPTPDGGPAWQSAQLRDVTILIPTRTSLPHLRAALDRHSIPYRLDTGSLVYDSQEVRDVLAALRAVDDPTNELALVAALRSPLYACSDVDLFTYRQAGGHWALHRPVGDDVPADHPVRAALEHLNELWQERRWSSPSRLLDRLVRDRRAFLLAFGSPRPKDVWRRLRFVVDQARAFEDAGGGGLAAFLDWADLQSAEAARAHEPLLPETDDDAVRILTVHGAKGLEFPITILSGMTTKSSGRRPGIKLVWGEGDSIELSVRKGVTTENYDPRADLEAEMDDYEKLRLLYVACTRARDHLVVACHHKTGDDSFAGRVWRLMHPRHDLVQPTIEWPPVPSADDSHPEGDPPPLASFDEARELEARAEWLAHRERLMAAQRESRVLSATAIARQAGQRTAADAASIDGQPTDDLVEDLAENLVDDLVDDETASTPDDDGTEALAPRRRGRAGTAIGRAVHATLQVLDLSAPHAIDEQARRQAELEAIPDLAETVASMVRAALASDAVALAVAHPHHKELYLATPVGERVIEGYVDLLIETPTGLVVVDYKTDTVRSEADIDAKLALYELQGAAYAVALEQITGQPVVDCRFVFCRSQGAVERSVADLDAAKARVRLAVGASG